MPRHVFTLQVRTDRLEEYRRRHAAVWPEMLTALHAAGWHGYTLHLREDGLVVGVVEADDLDGALAAVAATDADARWQSEMAPLLAGPTSGGPDRGLRVLPGVFDLDEQLAAAGAGSR